MHSKTNQSVAPIKSGFSTPLRSMHGEHHKVKTMFRSGEFMLPNSPGKSHGLNKKPTKAAAPSTKEEFMHLDSFSHWILM